MAAGWKADRRFVADTGRPALDDLLSRLAPEPGQTILELACGTGEVGFAVARAVGDEGRVILSDFAPEMIAAARELAEQEGLSNVEHRILDAEDLELPDACVDGVVCRWGYMLMPRPARALAHTRRVLRSGGRLAFAVFAEPAANPWASMAAEVLVAGGHMPRPTSGTPGICALGDKSALAAMVQEAGFERIEVQEVPLRFEYADGDQYWAFLNQLAGALSAVLAQLEPASRAAVRREIDGRLEGFRRSDGAAGYALAGLSLNVLAL
jgi:ubiquinone/menaquinone biosynthesis C-methylase UbiE